MSYRHAVFCNRFVLKSALKRAIVEVCSGYSLIFRWGGMFLGEVGFHRYTGPEVRRILQLHEEVFHCSVQETVRHHHEDTNAFQKKFVEDVVKLKSVMTEFGNPFLEESGDLIALITGLIAPKEAALNVLTMEKREENNIKSTAKRDCLEQYQFMKKYRKTTFSSSRHLR